MAPRDIAMTRPPAAARVSIQPGNGLLFAEMMIDGLRMVTDKLPHFFAKTRSAIDFEKVYVFEYLPSILASYSATLCGPRATIFSTNPSGSPAASGKS